MAVQMQLLKRHFSSIIRLIKRSRLDRVEQIRHATYETLRNLGVKRDLSKVVNRTPTGSDQGDVSSILAWIKKIREPAEGADKSTVKDFRQAVKQVVAIDATAVARVGK